MTTGTCFICGAERALMEGRSHLDKKTQETWAALNRKEDRADKVVEVHYADGKRCKGSKRVPAEVWQQCVGKVIVGAAKKQGPRNWVTEEFSAPERWVDEWSMVRLSATEPWEMVCQVWESTLRHLTATPLMRAAFEFEKEGGRVEWLDGMAKFLIEKGMDRGVVKEFLNHRGINDVEWARMRVESIRARDEYKMLAQFVDDVRKDPSLERLLRRVYPQLGDIRSTDHGSNKAKRQAECLEQVVEDTKEATGAQRD